VDDKGTRWVIQVYGNIGRSGENKFGWSNWLGPFYSKPEYNTDPDEGTNCAYFRHAKWTAQKLIQHFEDHVTDFAKFNWSFRLLESKPKKNPANGKIVYKPTREQWLWPTYMVQNDNILSLDRLRKV
jgi:hypothetical protein